jgi:hypothetical protein
MMMHLLEVQDYLLIFMIGAVLLIFLVLEKQEMVAQSVAEIKKLLKDVQEEQRQRPISRYFYKPTF